jgi:hypothetical protein
MNQNFPQTEEHCGVRGIACIVHVSCTRGCAILLKQEEGTPCTLTHFFAPSASASLHPKWSEVNEHPCLVFPGKWQVGKGEIIFRVAEISGEEWRLLQVTCVWWWRPCLVRSCDKAHRIDRDELSTHTSPRLMLKYGHFTEWNWRSWPENLAHENNGRDHLPTENHLKSPECRIWSRNHLTASPKGMSWHVFSLRGPGHSRLLKECLLLLLQGYWSFFHPLKSRQLEAWFWNTL